MTDSLGSAGKKTSLDTMDKMAFEDALQELEGLVRQLEEGQIPLEQAIQSYERGILLKKHCEEKLNQAKLRLDQITQTTPTSGDGPGTSDIPSTREGRPSLEPSPLQSEF